MSDTTENDDWAELARELERNKPVLPPLPVDESSVEIAAEGEDFSEGLELSTESELETNGDANGEDGVPGTGRKRRRRRRRRRKGGQSAGAGTDGADEGEEAGESGETGEVENELEPATSRGYDDEAETDDPNGDMEVEEDAGGELLRELIANWNVPSWDDVVGGLYRPER